MAAPAPKPNLVLSSPYAYSAYSAYSPVATYAYPSVYSSSYSSPYSLGYSGKELFFVASVNQLKV